MAVRTHGLDDLLSRLAGDPQRYFGDPAAVVDPVLRLERPFSTLLRLRVLAGGRESFAFLKVFKTRNGDREEVEQLRRWVEREFRATHRLHQALHDRPGLTAVRPVAVFPDRLALVTEEIHGRTLDGLLRRALWGREPIERTAALAARVGAWVRTYQQVTEAEGELSLDERREYLDVRLHRMRGHAIDDAERMAALRLFDRLAAAVPPGALGLVAIHADLSPTNILVGDDDAVTVLDFAMAKTGARHHDVSHLFLHFDRLRWRPALRRSVVDRIQEALLRGYDAALTPRDPLFALMLLQHAACYVAQFTAPPGARGAVRRVMLRRRWERSVEHAARAAR